MRPSAALELVTATEPTQDYRRFLCWFFGIWAIYDALDLVWGGTAASFWMTAGEAGDLRKLAWIQAGLLSCELAGWVSVRRDPAASAFTRLALGACLVLRAIEAWGFFGLNDFYYYCVTVLVLSQFAPAPGGVLRWPRQVLRYQTAWIYLATGFLKLNSHFLSGDHLWVREQYLLRALQWPHPAWVAAILGNPAWDRWLAWVGAGSELALGCLIAAGAPRCLVTGWACVIHGFAALALNVWFFGASMVAQAWFVSGGSRAHPTDFSFESGNIGRSGT